MGGTATVVASGEVISIEVDRYVNSLLKNGKAANVGEEFGRQFFRCASNGHDAHVDFVNLNGGESAGISESHVFDDAGHATKRQYRNTNVLMYGDILENIDEPALGVSFKS